MMRRVRIAHTWNSNILTKQSEVGRHSKRLEKNERENLKTTSSHMKATSFEVGSLVFFESINAMSSFLTGSRL